MNEVNVSRPRSKKGVTFDEVRALLLEMPGVEERPSYGTPAFRCRGKMLARFHQDGQSLVLKVEYVPREVLMAAHPETFYITDHYRCWPLMLVRLSNAEPGLLRGLIEDAWRTLASKRDLAAYNAKRTS
jgi:hypothetical protein